MDLLKKSISFISAAVIAAGTVIPISADEEEYESAEYSGARVYGDFNGDDIADLKDILLLCRCLVNDTEIEGDTRCIDLNYDGIVDISDLILLKDGVLHSGVNLVGRPIYDEEQLRSEGMSGIDVSRWQGEIDWQGVKDYGIEFVMIKAGEGVEEEINFRKNIDGAKSVGIKCGVYWFANAQTTDEAILEAQACLRTISDYELEFPVAYDFEYRTVDNKPLAENREIMTQIVRTFLLYIQKEGYYPLLYSNLDFLRNYFDEKDLGQFDLWYARYMNKPEPDKPCFIWQRSCKGRISGIKYDVDLDTGYKDYYEVIRKYQWNHWESYPPAETTEESTETTVDSTEPTDESTDTTLESTEPTDEPTDTTLESTEPTDETTDTAVETTEPTDESTETTLESTEPTDETTDTAVETTEPTDESTETTAVETVE